jgi:hypothetical protein
LVVQLKLRKVCKQYCSVYQKLLLPGKEKFCRVSALNVDNTGTVPVFTLSLYQGLYMVFKTHFLKKIN